MFVAGFLALVSAINGAAVTECTSLGYARQPINFGNPKFGVCVNAQPWSFGAAPSGTFAGRAIFDAPTGGNLLMILPFSSARPISGSPGDGGDVGAIALNLSLLSSYADGSAYSAEWLADFAPGITYDTQDTIGITSTAPTPAAGITVLPQGGMFLSVRASPITLGTNLIIARGQAQAAAYAAG